MLQHFFVSNVLFHFFVLNMDVSKSTCQIWPFISKKMLNMYLFMHMAHVCSFYKRNMSCAVSVSTYSMDIGHVAYKWILLTVSSFLCESFWFPILGDCALTDPLFSPHSGQVTVTFWPRFHRTVTGSDRRNFKCWNLEP